MRIACPACNAAYEVPDHLIGPGRRLRCAKCGHDWAVQPAEPATEVAAAEGAAAPDMRSPTQPSPPPAATELPRDLPPHPVLRRPPQVIDPPLPRLGDAPPAQFVTGLRVAWAASVLAVLVLLALLLVFRAEIAAAWPPAARLYMALGMEVGH
jgi:predicted Zn finger-like uncharacterized protein